MWNAAPKILILMQHLCSLNRLAWTLCFSVYPQFCFLVYRKAIAEPDGPHRHCAGPDVCPRWEFSPGFCIKRQDPTRVGPQRWRWGTNVNFCMSNLALWSNLYSKMAQPFFYILILTGYGYMVCNPKQSLCSRSFLHSSLLCFYFHLISMESITHSCSSLHVHTHSKILAFGGGGG